MEELTNKEKEVKRIKEMQDKEAKKVHNKIVIKYIVGTLVTVIAVIAAFCVSVPTGLFCLLGFPFCFAFGAFWGMNSYFSKLCGRITDGILKNADKLNEGKVLYYTVLDGGCIGISFKDPNKIMKKKKVKNTKKED